MPFKIHSPFKPAGDQPEAIKKLIAGIEKKYRYQTLLGVTGSGKSVVSKTPVLIMQQGRVRFEYIGQLIDEVFDTFTDRITFVKDTEVIETSKLPKNSQIKTYSIDPTTKKSSWKSVLQLTRHKSPNDLYQVNTKCGREIVVTGDHNFFALRKGHLELLETRLLNRQDFLPLPLTLPGPKVPLRSISIPDSVLKKLYISIPNFKQSWLPYRVELKNFLGPAKIFNLLNKQERLPWTIYQKIIQKLPKLKVSRPMVGLYAQDYKFPANLPLTDSLLRFFGYYIGEGHAEARYFTISSGAAEVVADFTKTCEELRVNWQGRPGTYDYQISSSLLTELFAQTSGSRANKKRLPKFWMELNNRQLSELLKAYFSADGGVNGPTVSCCTVSPTLASDIQYALFRFGIVSRTRKRQMKVPNKNIRHTIWEIHISGQKFLQIFRDEIGFTIFTKTQALKNITKISYNTNVDLIPNLAWLKKARQQLNLSQTDLAKHCRVGRSHVSLIEGLHRSPAREIYKKLLNFLAQRASKQGQKNLQSQIQDKLSFINAYWTPIKSVKKIPSEPYVYDFSVADNETFLAGMGGIFVHNTFTMANVIQKVQRPTLIISHNKTLAAQLASEFQDFFPDNAVHYFVSYYDYYQPEAYIPRSDTYIEKETQINEEIDKLRNAATQSLLERQDVIIVASVSCIYGLGNPENYESLALPLQIGTKIKRDKFLRRLTDLQFLRNDINLTRGTYRVRGDVVELVPASADKILRLDFFGDTLEKISEHDPLTGADFGNRQELTIFPAKHFVTPKEKLQLAVENIRKELANQVKLFKSQDKQIEAQRIEQRTNFDIEMMLETGFVAGIENYSRQLDFRKAGEPPSTLLDYFPDDFLLFIDESHITLPQIGAMYMGDQSRKKTLVDYGFRLPSAMDNRPLKFEEFEKRIDQTIFVSATPEKDRELKISKQVAEQIIRPTGLLDPEIEVRPTKNQVDDLMEEMQKRVKSKQRVLVTTLTKNMAEELSNYLTEYGIKVQYLHSDIETLHRLEILRDLRLGVYDVVVGINLLREGLDLPEVSLVAILDADKEGFLRSETSLIQTMGRAARHLEGHVIMYADRITGSMQRAMDEVTRRRKIQEDYNTKHGITPLSIQKAIKDSRLAGQKLESEIRNPKSEMDLTKMTKQDIAYLVEELRDQMDLASRNLDFEKAALLRDQITTIRTKTKMKKHKFK